MVRAVRGTFSFLCFFLALGVVAGVVWATTHHSVTVDGDLGDFAADEKTAGDPSNDSDYGYNNELNQLLVTWDASHLYLGFDYVAWGAAVIYLVETGKSGGTTQLCPNQGWTGPAFPANVQTQAADGMDLMVAVYLDDTGAAPTAYLYTLSATSSTDISSVTGVQVTVKETVDTTTQEHKGAVEAAIPWGTIYGLGAGKVPAGAQLKIAGLLRGKNDGDGLGDLSPGAKGVPKPGNCWSSDANLLSQFHQVTVDSDGDGDPDPGWSPGPNVAKSDGGPPQDSAPPPDLSPAPDGKLLPDTMPPPDGPPSDTVATDLHQTADSSPDSSPAADSGIVDSAGPLADAGLDGGAGDKQEEGCACSAKASTPPSASLIALLILGLVTRVRRT
jgi:MYXO-CTERM domain-containing protein